jgi:hypothetical protein
MTWPNVARVRRTTPSPPSIKRGVEGGARLHLETKLLAQRGALRRPPVRLRSSLLGWRSSEDRTKLVFGLFECLPALRAQVPASAVDVEDEHGERRAKGLGFAARALFCRALQRLRDGAGACQRKDVRLEIEGVARLGYVPGPSTGVRHVE